MVARVVPRLVAGELDRAVLDAARPDIPARPTPQRCLWILNSWGWPGSVWPNTPTDACAAPIAGGERLQRRLKLAE